MPFVALPAVRQPLSIPKIVTILPGKRVCTPCKGTSGTVAENLMKPPLARKTVLRQAGAEAAGAAYLMLRLVTGVFFKYHSYPANYFIRYRASRLTHLEMLSVAWKRSRCFCIGLR